MGADSKSKSSNHWISQDLGPDLAQPHLHHILLDKAGHSVSPNLKRGETDSNLWWEEYHAHPRRGGIVTILCGFHHWMPSISYNKNKNMYSKGPSPLLFPQGWLRLGSSCFSVSQPSGPSALSLVSNVCVYVSVISVSVTDVHPAFQLTLENAEKERASHFLYFFQHPVLYKVKLSSVTDCLEKRSMLETSVEDNVDMGRERGVWGPADSIQSG